MGEGRGIRRAARAYLLFEGGKVVVLVIGNFAGISVRAAFHRGFALRTVGNIIFTGHRSSAHVVLHLRHFTVGTIGIGEAIRGFIVIPHAGDALETVIGVDHLAAIAVSHVCHSAVRVIGGGGQRLRAHLHGGRTSNGIISEVIGHVVCTGSRRIMFHLSELVLGIGIAVGIFLAVYRGRGLGHLAVLVIFIFDRLAARVGDRLHCVNIDPVGWIHDACYGFAPRVCLRQHMIAVFIIARSGLHEERTIAGLAGQLIAMAVIGILVHNAQRTGRLAQQMLLLFGIRGSPLHGGLYRGRPAGLVVGQDVVKGVIGRAVLQAGRVLGGEHIALAVIGIRLAELLLMQEQAAELGVVDVPLIVYIEADRGIGTGCHHGPSGKLPIRPLLAPLNGRGIFTGRRGAGL